MDWKTAKKQLLKDPEARKAYHQIDLPFEVSKLVTDMRIEIGLTQAELAKRVGTKQESIARLESGNTLPSLSFLAKVTEAMRYEIIIKARKKP